MKRAPQLLLLALSIGALGAPLRGDAQILDKLKKKAQQQIEKKVDQVGKDSAAAKDSATGPAKAQPSAAQGAAQQPAAQQQPGQGAWANYDFVPGERVLFFEDFSKDRVGNFPKRLELLHGNMEIVEWNARRWLRVNTTGAFELKLPENLPDRFTMEFDVTIPHAMFEIYTGACPEEGPPGDLKDRAAIYVSQFYKAGVMGAGRKSMALMYPKDVLPDSVFTGGYQITKPVRVRVHADGKYVKVYLEEHRVANVPNADLVRTNQLIFHFGLGPGNKSLPLITNISINAGGRPMYEALMADGRFVTQGIFFDTGSDRLRPESTPTLKEIGEMLAEHPELKLEIQGHTDAVGDDASNLTLSEKRAAAVKTYLVTNHKVDAARLQAKGYGETKPVGSNDTAEGRQQNRRVELVKL